jgi:hypothetical protein
MPEEPTTTDTENESEHRDLLDALYNRLGVGELTTSLIVNGVIREEILRVLIRAGMLTPEGLATTLDRAEKEIAEVCDEALSKHSSEDAIEILQKMKDRAKSITNDIRDRVIKSSSMSPDESP